MFCQANAWLVTRYRYIFVIVLLAAAALRVAGLNNISPPGLEHDEVAHWLINRDILAGNQALYFSEAYGHEAGFHYVQAGFMALLGDNTYALRLPSALTGLLLVAVTFALTRRLFDLTTALLAAALLAVLFWPVFYSRLALRAISLPLFSGLSAYFWLLGWQRAQAILRLAAGRPAVTRNLRQTLHSSTASPEAAFLLAGVLAGMSFYTYMAARAVPFFYALFALYLALFHRPALRRAWRSILLFFLAYTVVAGPLVIFLLANPEAEARVSEVNQPLLALVNGQLQPVLQNGLKVINMFGLRGDPLWRQNIAYLPVFEPVVALFFYIGVLISLWRWRSINHLFLILWLLTSFIPSIVTIDAPSSIRVINALVVITVFPVIGLQVIHTFSRLSTVSQLLSTKTGKYLALLTLLLFMLLYMERTTQAVFQTWPADKEVQFVWQQALTKAAAYLDRSADNGPVSVGGWSPDTMDPPTMALTLRRDDLSLRYFQPQESLILPAFNNDKAVRLLYPAILPLDPYLEFKLDEWGAKTSPVDSDFILIYLPEVPLIQPQYPARVSFDEQLTFLGYDQILDCQGQSTACQFVTYWRVDKPAGGKRRFFLHLVDESGEVVSQDDSLGAPAEYWQAGDIIVQLHTLEKAGPDTSGIFRLGVYNPDTGIRLSGKPQPVIEFTLQSLTAIYSWKAGK